MQGIRGEQGKAIRIEGICKSSQKVCFLSHLVSDGREDRQVAALLLYRRFDGWTGGSGLLQNQVPIGILRDGKQHAGITNCQSTDFRKLDFHFNASLAAVNLAKAACKRLGIAIPYPLASHSYTMLICLNDLFACSGLTQTCKLLTNFSKNSFYLLPEPLRIGEFLTNYCV